MSTRELFSWNTRSLLRDGKPWIPMMGEFHYSRYPKSKWREEIQKMKACGVNIIATYTFWIHHEEREGAFDFTDRRDVGTFLKLCKECGVYAWLRVGPWCHGEARNGGFPDWLTRKGISLRSNDDRYLRYVRRYWEQLYHQTKDTLYENGGAVIGIQIENEFGHCGGDGDPSHMETLQFMAREIGFIAPYYSATGWGGAVIGPMLPVMSCYCDAPWSSLAAPLPPSPNYLFSHERNDVDVGSDFQPGENLSFDAEAYPYLMAEIGGGIFVTFHRRPVAAPIDTSAMSFVKLGSGANMLGYYMYHGGTNPGGELNETRESGSYSETPTLTYFPHAPIGEYGQISESAKELKRIAMFLESFGEMLAPLPCTLPEEGAKQPTDTESPRYAWRALNGSGFLFVNNYQRGLSLPARVFTVPDFGKVKLKSGQYGIFPRRLPLGKATLLRANATPLCVLNKKTYVFWCDEKPFYEWDGDTGDLDVITLTGQEARNAWRVRTGGIDALYLCEYPIITDERGAYADARSDFTVRALPDGRRDDYKVPRGHSKATYARTGVNAQCYEYKLTFAYDGEANDTFLYVEYEGSVAELFVDGVKVADDMYDGSVWEVGLRRFGFPKNAVLRVYALFEGMPVWLEQPPAYEDGRALRLRGLTMENRYRIRINL